MQRQCETFPSQLKMTGRNGCFRVTNDPQYPNAFQCQCVTDECNLIDADKMAELWRTGGRDWHPNQPPWFSEDFNGETSPMPSPPTMQPLPGWQANIIPFNNLTFHIYPPTLEFFSCWTCKGSGNSCDYPNRRIYDQLYSGPQDGCAVSAGYKPRCVTALHSGMNRHISGAYPSYP